MKILVYIPYHKKDSTLLINAIRDVERQIFESSINYIEIDILVVANNEAPLSLAIASEKKIIYMYVKDISSAADARNFALNYAYHNSYDYFTGHDYDDVYCAIDSLSTLLEPLVRYDSISLIFGKSEFCIESTLRESYEDSLLFKSLYPNFLSIEEFYRGNITITTDALMLYILYTGYFPTQATLYNTQIAYSVGGYPLVKSLEDRIFTLEFLRHCKNGNRIEYIPKNIVQYKIHNKSLSFANHSSGIRSDTLGLLSSYLHPIINTNKINYNLHSCDWSNAYATNKI